MFLAYSNFAPTALSSDGIADYVKNHFFREMIFGTALAVWTIKTALQPVNTTNLIRLLLLGSIVVLPFWVASLFGWSTGGIEEVWGDSLRPNGAYFLHGPQTAMFFAGIALLWFSSKPTPGAQQASDVK
jgi:hypothetical protein